VRSQHAADHELGEREAVGQVRVRSGPRFHIGTFGGIEAAGGVADQEVFGIVRHTPPKYRQPLAR
jgi:hypothetical protein